MSVPHQPADNTPDLVMAEAIASPAPRLPRRALFIVGNEACERFSYYGMSSILTLYLVKHLGHTDERATEVKHIFNSACYLMPLFGAFLADRWLGRYLTIMSLSVFYCLGHLALAVFEGSEKGMYLGLALIALGAGGIKPCVSAFVGDQFDDSNKALLTRVYSLFYWAINFGSFFSFLVIPFARDHWGYSWAFGIPGILMGLALLIFAAGSRTYTRVPPAGRQPGFFAVVKHSLTCADQSRPFWDRSRGKFDDELVDGCRRVAGVLGLFAVIPVFWALFDQTGSTWILQGAAMRAVEIPLPFTDKPFRLDAESMQAMNPAMVMLLIPFCAFVLYPAAKRFGVLASPLSRMTAGMGLAALSFVASAAIQTRIEVGDSLSVLWQIVPYLLLTLGEVLFSTTGLEFAFTQAPKSMKSTLMSFWSLTVAAGNLLVAGIAHQGARLFGSADKTAAAPIFGGGATAQFLFFAALMGVVTVVFGFVAKRYMAKHGS